MKILINLPTAKHPSIIKIKCHFQTPLNPTLQVQNLLKILIQIILNLNQKILNQNQKILNQNKKIRNLLKTLLIILVFNKNLRYKIINF
jgi:hypothetical protein